MIRTIGPAARRALAHALVLVLAAGCGDEGTGPGGGGSDGDDALTAFASGVGDARTYFANNGSALVALQTFAPFFATGFSGSSVPRLGMFGSSLLSACIDPGLAGTTFEFDFSQNAYVAGAMSGAPSDGIRFLLYQEQQQRGHADVACPGDLPVIDVTIAIQWDGVTVLELAGDGLFNQDGTWLFESTTATVRNPANGNTLDFGLIGDGVGTTVVSSRITFEVADMTVTFGRDDAQGVEVSGQASANLWSVSLNADGPVDGQLVGTMRYAPNTGGAAVIACLSGFYDDLTIATDESLLELCSGSLPYRTFVPDPQTDLTDAYDALRSMLDVMTAILGTGIGIAASAAT